MIPIPAPMRLQHHARKDRALRRRNRDRGRRFLRRQELIREDCRRKGLDYLEEMAP